MYITQSTSLMSNIPSRYSIKTRKDCTKEDSSGEIASLEYNLCLAHLVLRRIKVIMEWISPLIQHTALMLSMLTSLRMLPTQVVVIKRRGLSKRRRISKVNDSQIVVVEEHDNLSTETKLKHKANGVFETSSSMRFRGMVYIFSYCWVLTSLYIQYPHR